MSDFTLTWTLTNKKHGVFPSKFQPLISVYFMVVLKTKQTCYFLHVEDTW